MKLASFISRVTQYLKMAAARSGNLNRNFPRQFVEGEDRIIWVDLEMTGLDEKTDHIIEMACIVTDKNLEVIAQSSDIVIHQSDEILNNMNDWCIQHHGESGLTEKCRKSNITLEMAEKEMLKFVRKHTPAGKCPLAGSSIAEDKRFLNKYMPDFIEHLHYRIIDVSSIKELTRRWNFPALRNAPKKKLAHRALDDILDSIAELKYYRRAVFK